MKALKMKRESAVKILIRSSKGIAQKVREILDGNINEKRIEEIKAQHLHLLANSSFGLLRRM